MHRHDSGVGVVHPASRCTPMSEDVSPQIPGGVSPHCQLRRTAGRCTILEGLHPLAQRSSIQSGQHRECQTVEMSMRAGVPRLKVAGPTPI